jgi:hypothetical protein
MTNKGIKALLARYRKQFRVKENLNYYSKEDYQKAEKKYLKYRLTNGRR